MFAAWQRFILDYAHSCSGQFAVPLSDGDVEKTAGSVARFTWMNPSFGKPVDPGRRDSDVQRRRSRLGVLARQRRVVDRNRTILAMHEDGLGIRAIGREIDLSASQVCRVVQAGPPVLHNPVASSEFGCGGFTLTSEGYGIRNGRADYFQSETRHENLENRSETVVNTLKSDETRLNRPPDADAPARMREIARQTGLPVADILQSARDASRTGWTLRLSAAALDLLHRRPRDPPG